MPHMMFMLFLNFQACIIQAIKSYLQNSFEEQSIAPAAETF